MPLKKLLVVSSLTITGFAIPNAVIAQNRATPGQFDFYVLALSWSPDYCAKNGDRDQQQCKLGKKLGFVLHGLWPQHQKGYPANCSTQKLPSQIKQQFPGLFPSDKLYNHEWEKHGTCSGLSPVQYLALSKHLKDSVIIPTAYNRPPKPFRTTIKDLKNTFVSANSTFTTDGIAPQCSGSGRFLQEIFVCYTKDGKPGACSAELLQRSQKTCGQPNFLVRNVR
ncbi:MAG: ribonuclease [Mojavia pulchra JT2-VF2]|uniref:Ribonuclease n=1 Tax=Mojavia pulchra JT2-VF2 TaxID=287848 RepID=A0A951Q2K7_9NOST|nr:ribonuclease [Mojavia pulchra JT2-VF2]